MTFKEFYNKYCNGITFIVAIFSSILITLFIASTILSIGRIFIFPEKQQYISNNISMWSEWYKICPNEKCELIDLREPFLFDYSINSKYKYEKTYDEIVEEYKKVLEKENWQFLQKNDNKITYVKDGLLFSIFKLPDGSLQTKVWLKSDMK